MKERFYDTSDKYYVYVCNKTGLIAVGNKEKKLFKSLYTDEETDFSKIKIPYATKLFIQELMSLGITPRIRTTKTNQYVLGYEDKEGKKVEKVIVNTDINETIEEETDDEGGLEEEISDEEDEDLEEGLEDIEETTIKQEEGKDTDEEEELEDEAEETDDEEEETDDEAEETDEDVDVEEDEEDIEEEEGKEMEGGNPISDSEDDSEDDGEDSEDSEDDGEEDNLMDFVDDM